MKKGELEFCACPEERSHALAPPIGKCVKNLKKFCKRGAYSSEMVEGVGKQNSCQCGENMRFNPVTFTCEKEETVLAKCSESCSAHDLVRTYAPCCRQLDIWIRRHKWKGRTLSLWGAWSSCDQTSCTKTRRYERIRTDIFTLPFPEKASVFPSVAHNPFLHILSYLNKYSS